MYFFFKIFNKIGVLGRWVVFILFEYFLVSRFGFYFFYRYVMILI